LRFDEYHGGLCEARDGEGPSRERLIDTALHSIRQPMPVWNQIAGVRMKRLLNLVMGMALLLALVGCNVSKSFEWHRKLTITVDTPSGPVSGSSVVREYFAEIGAWLFFPETAGTDYGLFGDAPFVQVAPGKYLFALLPQYQSRSAQPSSFETFFPGENPSKIAPRLSTLREKRNVATNQFPIFVTFENIENPDSVKLVDPSNLAASFGEGYSLKGLTLEITAEEVTDGLMDRLLPILSKDQVFIDVGWLNLPFNHPLRSVDRNSFVHRAIR
jgi:hypothetical protein